MKTNTTLGLTKELKLNLPLQFEHLYSAEIVPFKQAFIELNFSPELLFRDIIEMAQSDDNKAYVFLVVRLWKMTDMRY